MLTKAEQFLIFCDKIECDIEKETQIEHGKNLIVSLKGEKSIVTIFDNGNVRIQGKDNSLKQMLLQWNNKRTSNYETDSGHWFGQVDLPAGWREWNEEAKWLTSYIQNQGYPDDSNIPVDYSIAREIMFHDYMFRQRQSDEIDNKLLDFLIRNWINRYCFMNLDVNAVLSDFWESVELARSDNLCSIGDFAWSISYAMACNCPNKFIKNEAGEYVCPLTKDDQNLCVCQIVDDLYAYNNEGKMLSFTKGNFVKLLKGKGNLSWISIRPTTPIEEIMERGLKDAGIITVPQFQAFDANHKYRIDFVVKTDSGENLAIECDGLEYHAKKENYIHDAKKNRYLQAQGFQMMRFSSIEIFQNIDACIKEIDEQFWRIQRGELIRPGHNRLSYFNANR